jgi:hypothetical protein
METQSNLKPFFLFALILLASLLAGCNKPATDETSQAMNVTQAYQTVEARLTEALAQTATPPPATPTPELAQATATPTLAQPTETTLPATPATATATRSAATTTDCDLAAPGFPSIDVTIEDDTATAPGASFTKIWRLVNTGTCTWSTEYQVVWFSGEQMGAPTAVPLAESVAPGQTIDIAVDMIAPQQSGTYQSNWKLRNPSGDLFGIGPDAFSAFWVRIVVTEGGALTPTATPTSTYTPPIVNSGSATLVISDTLDLDSLRVNAPGADLSFDLVQAGDDQHQLVPIGGATLGLYGQAQPDLPACQNIILSAAAVIIETLTPGSYLCYETDQGLPGWVRYDSFSADEPALSLTILTWASP